MSANATRNFLARDARLVGRSLTTAVGLSPHTRQSWETRASHVRDTIRWWSGPRPGKCYEGRDARILGRVERDGFHILNVAIPSLPGFYATGNLYVPEGAGPFPVILNPHGHWPAGRFEDSALVSVPARCINFALRGYVALNYDMVGYGDSRPIGHRFGADDEELESWTISLLGLQLENSIACLDHLCSLPYVDSSRIGCVGASGGASQAMLLAALDERVGVVALVNMISSTCQGWCLCENCAGLRLETHNVEIAATLAPRPLLLVSASGDWTSMTPKVEFPWIQSIYQLYGTRDRVANVHVDAPHNFNMTSRQAVYRWFDRWFMVEGSDEEYLEIPFPTGNTEVLRVPLESMPLASEGEIIHSLKLAAQADADSCLRDTGDKARSQLARCFGLTERQSAPSVVATLTVEESPGRRTTAVLLRKHPANELLPCTVIEPTGETSNAVVVLADGGGEELVHESAGLVGRCIEAGYAVVVPDLFLTGAWASANGRLGRTRGHPFFGTYNRTDSAETVRDAAAAIDYVAEGMKLRVKVVVGIGASVFPALFAAAMSSRVSLVALDLCSPAPRQRFFVPGLKRAGSVSAALHALTPLPLLVFGVGDENEMVQKAVGAYAAHPKSITILRECLRCELSIARLLSDLAAV